MLIACHLPRFASKYASTIGTLRLTHLLYSLNRQEPYSPRGHQSIAITTLGLPEFADFKQGLSTAHVYAGMAVRQGGLKPFRHETIDGEDCICLSLPVSTKPEFVMPHERVVPIPDVLDRRGILKAHIQQKGHVVTNRNLLTVNLATSINE